MRLKKPALFVAAALCLPIFVIQVMTYLSPFRSVGFTRETWHATDPVAHHGNWGAVDDGQGLYLFVEHEQSTLPPDALDSLPLERASFSAAGSPPQFTVGDSTFQKDWTFLRTGYQYSTVDITYRRGQYHLVRIHPLFVLIATGLVVGVGIRGALSSYRRRRRTRAGCCANCGYDLRSGHDVCPECGSVSATRSQA